MSLIPLPQGLSAIAANSAYEVQKFAALLVKYSVTAWNASLHAPLEPTEISPFSFRSTGFVTVASEPVAHGNGLCVQAGCRSTRKLHLSHLIFPQVP